MKSILVTYPDFRSLPKGIKRMLLISESLFFEAAKPASDPYASHEAPVTLASHDLGDWARIWALQDWMEADSHLASLGAAGYGRC